MITAQDIREKGFERSKFNGYDMDSVDDFLEEVADSIGILQKEKADLQKYTQKAGAGLGDFIYEDVDGNGKVTPKCSFSDALASVRLVGLSARMPRPKRPSG